MSNKLKVTGVEEDIGWDHFDMMGFEEYAGRQTRMMRDSDYESYPFDDMSGDEKLAYDGLKAAQRLANKTATDAGWYTDPKTGEPVKRNFGEVVALMHSELSEALEADRKGLMDDKLPHRKGQEVEFADCIIRQLDTSEAEGYDIAGAFIEKNRYNQKRPDHKLETRKAGGKKY